MYVVDAHFIDKIEEEKSWTQVPVVVTGNYKKKSSYTFLFR
jgi:hypothetical protein